MAVSAAPSGPRVLPRPHVVRGLGRGHLQSCSRDGLAPFPALCVWWGPSVCRPGSRGKASGSGSRGWQTAPAAVWQTASSWASALPVVAEFLSWELAPRGLLVLSESASFCPVFSVCPHSQQRPVAPRHWAWAVRPARRLVQPWRAGRLFVARRLRALQGLMAVAHHLSCTREACPGRSP